VSEPDVATDAPFDAPRQPPPAQRHGMSTRVIIEWVIVIVAAVTVAALLRTFVVQTFWIPSASMEPTLMTGDRVVVNKLSYRLHDVHRGDIVVFTTPPGVSENYKDLIKRVIALPGESVQGTDGKVVVDGRPIDESYLPDGTFTTDLDITTVPEDSVWVMGDNRDQSSDSREFGAIRESTIVGRAFVRIWPLSRFGFL
jgi:signal peptidase I